MVGAPPPRSHRFRPDIEGLRAIAVGLVLLYHVGMPGFAGGYVGVDVFFVISGFLITGLLIRELNEQGRISLGRFFARRIRRLLPASVLVGAVTILLALVFLPPLQVRELRPDAISAALYVSNIYFAITQTDYLAAHASASPFQHYWSLAVEEQFYLLWPLLLICIAAASRRLGMSLPRLLTIAISSLAAASLAASVIVTGRSQPLAFFLLPTRAWELAIGGLLALWVARGPAVARLPGWAGLVGLSSIAVAVVIFDGTTRFPGSVALLPVMGTVAVLASGVGMSWLSPVFCAPAMQWIGARSYSLYLWHWPLLVFTDGVPGGALSVAGRIVVLGATVILADLTFRYVETPIRHHPIVSRTLGRSLTFGVLLSGVAAMMAVLVPALPVLEGTGEANVAEAGELDGLLLQPTEVLPAQLRPSLDAIREGQPVIYEDGCHRGFASVDVDGCEYGPEDADRTIWLFGDSHAAHWFPAVERMSQDAGWRVVSMTKSSCSTPDLPAIFQSDVGRVYRECPEWKDNVLERMAAEQPDLVIMAAHVNARRRSEHLDEWLEAYERMITAVQDTGTQVVLLAESPLHDVDPPVCVSEHASDLLQCAGPFTEVVDARLREGEEAISTRTGAGFLDTPDLVCGPQVCPVVVGDVLAYRDRHHFTPDFAELLAPVLRQKAADLLE